ncbi:HAD-like domain-containing protein, partial [Vararia minispora EC-137]
VARLGVLTLALGGLGAIVYMGREWGAEELKERRLTQENAPSTRYGRTIARLGSLFDFFSKPAWIELLPPPLPPPHQKPYTLLVSVDDLLVTSTWDRQHGWRTVKRPGVDYFICYLSQFYEIVIFTTQQSYTALPILEKLDPYNYFITYKLFREATRMGNNGPVKDLSYLNRPLDKVILLDAHIEHTTANPENAIVLHPWKGERGDKGLVEMIPFLESIGIYRPHDVRPILKAYEGKDIPREYALKEAAEKKAVIEEWKARGGGRGLSGGGFTLSGLFGGKEQAPAMPETYLEKKRREAQAFYLQEQQYLEDNKAEIERMMQADLEERQKEMGGTIFGMLAGFAPKPPPAP